MLPASRPIQLDLPKITGPADLMEAEEKILAALNAAKISSAEARTMQAIVKAAYRSRRIALGILGRNALLDAPFRNFSSRACLALDALGLHYRHPVHTKPLPTLRAL